MNDKTKVSAAERSTIMVIDDEPGNLLLLKETLTRHNYHVHPVRSGVMALDIVERVGPDLILLDINMPDLSGYEVCEKLKSNPQTQGIPVIFISALGEVMDKVKAFQVGGVDYVTKPFHFEEVLARIETHLTLRALQKELETRNAALREALETIKSLSGLIPICAWCGCRIQNESGQWLPVETYIETHSEAMFTHGICPECAKKFKRKP